MKKKKITAITLISMISASIAFALAYEHNLRTNEQKEIDNYADIIAVSLWNFEPKGPTEYLSLVCRRQNYKRLVVTDSDGEIFIDIGSGLQSRIDRFLVSLRLIRSSRISSDIIYEGRVIGKISAVWYPLSIYVYFYTAVIIVLSVMVLWFFLSTLEKSKELEIRAEFLKKMFGRYLSKEVMEALIENPESAGIGGEKRMVTIMMTDLRGFTPLAERLKPEQVLQLLNSYFEVMIDVVLKHNGTIDEIIGDALLVLFGAPQRMPDRAQRAIACAIEMQNAMAEVNHRNRMLGLPKLEMGIGLNEAEVIVGNIGSIKRSKYGVVGSGVNMTARIESYTIGGQILISKSVRNEAGDVLQIEDRITLYPKGAETPLVVYEVRGIGGQYNLTLEREVLRLYSLSREIPIRYTVLDGKYMGERELEGAIIRLSRKSAELRLQFGLELLINLKLNLLNVTEELSSKDFYGKVVANLEADPSTCDVQLRFTALPSEIDGYFQAALHQVMELEPEAI
ncbi:MAG: adenylate/guanylate cyclase domain-containing protein [Deltaproteobacteria bacterium]|nr:MAG: adenylate/guanylate cyclase domain-containing protein [Deltaproteobacteria bacterium]